MAQERADQLYDLEERLIDYAVRIIRMAKSLPEKKLANHEDWVSRSSQPYGLLILKKSERSDSALRHSHIRYSIFCGSLFPIFFSKCSLIPKIIPTKWSDNERYQISWLLSWGRGKNN